MCQKLTGLMLISLGIAVRGQDTFPKAIGEWAELPRAEAVAVEVVGDVAYVAANHLILLDVTDPLSPRQLAVHLMDQHVRDVAIRGTNAYIAVSQGLEIWDVTDPVNPKPQGRVEGTLSSRSVTISGDYAYVAGSPPMTIMDISDPTAPIIAGSYESDFTSNGIVIYGNHARTGLPEHSQSKERTH